MALIGAYNKDKEKEDDKKDKEKLKKEIKMRPDDWIEKTHLRNLALDHAKDNLFKLFDLYKKAHGMASFT